MLKRNRLFLYTVFALLHVFMFLFSLYVDKHSENLSFLIKLQGLIWMMKYGSAGLIILLVFILILHVRDNIRSAKEIHKLKDQVNEIKATLYDMQNKDQVKEIKKDNTDDSIE